MAMHKTILTPAGVPTEYHRITKLVIDLAPPNPNPGVDGPLVEITVSNFVSKDHRDEVQTVDTGAGLVERPRWLPAYTDRPVKVMPKPLRDALLSWAYETLSQPVQPLTITAQEEDPAQPGRMLDVQKVIDNPATVSNYNEAKPI